MLDRRAADASDTAHPLRSAGSSLRAQVRGAASVSAPAMRAHSGGEGDPETMGDRRHLDRRDVLAYLLTNIAGSFSFFVFSRALF